MNVTDTMARIENLEVNSTYHLFVVAVNEHGTSLPSSMLLLNITEGDILILPLDYIQQKQALFCGNLYCYNPIPEKNLYGPTYRKEL